MTLTSRERPVTSNPPTFTRLRALLGAVCISVSSVSFAQYADEEVCSDLASLDLPEVQEADSARKTTSIILDRFVEVNPDLPTEFSKQQGGWFFMAFALCFRQGLVVDKDIERSNQLLQIASDQGSRDAAHMVASIAVFQSDDPEEQEVGFKFLRREYEEEGSAYAAGKLGWAYQRGLGVEQDLTKAIELYKFAASQGMTYWQYLLAHAYEKGYLGLDVDEERAAYWLKFKPKVHIALYECWVAIYYQDGTFPKSDKLASEYQQVCDDTDIADAWVW